MVILIPHQYSLRLGFTCQKLIENNKNKDNKMNKKIRIYIKALKKKEKLIHRMTLKKAKKSKVSLITIFKTKRTMFMKKKIKLRR